ncbi:MAG: lysophospholipid acyltransferase family protein [Desulfobacteraceae bacterium]
MTPIDNFVYRSLSGFMDLIGRFSSSTGRCLGRILGSVWFALDRKHRHLCLDNLNHAFAKEKSQQEIKRIARNVFNNTAAMVFEHARFYRIGPEKAAFMMNVRGLDNLNQAYAKEKGVICFSAHLGNWELATSIAVISGFPFSVVYKTIEYPPFDRYITDRRNDTGCTMLPLHNALDQIRRCLADGGIAGLIVDQNTRKRHQAVFVDFMGRKASAASGPAKLALSTGAPVVPVFFFKENNTYTLEILPELPLIKTGDHAKDIFENTRQYHSLIESYVRKYPDQWFWLHNRWRTRPLDE